MIRIAKSRSAGLFILLSVLQFCGPAANQYSAEAALRTDRLSIDGQASVSPSALLDQFASMTKRKHNACPSGQNRDPSTGQCFSCSHNDHFDAERGECVPCKPGFHEAVQADDNGEEQSVCVADRAKNNTLGKKCPEGTELKNGKCRKSEFPDVEQCPEGQNADPQTGVCFSCSHNDHFDAAQGRCVPCKAGFHVDGDQCAAD